MGQRIAEALETPNTIGNIYMGAALAILVLPDAGLGFLYAWVDFIMLLGVFI